MHRITRRQVLRDGAGAGLALGLSGTLLAACGGSDEQAGRSTAAVPESPTKSIPTQPFDPNVPAGAKPGLPRRIGFAYPSDAQFYAMTLEAMKAGAEDADIEVLSASAGGDSNRNIQQINAFLTRGVAAMWPGPVDPKATVTLQKRAIDKGIAVLATSGQQPPTTNSFTGDQASIGRAQGEDAAKWIKERLGGNANVALLEDLSAIPALKPRTDAVIAALRAVGPGMKLVAKQAPRNQDQSSQAGYQLMTSVLQAHPDIDVVLAADSTSVGALAAMQAAGKVTPDLYVSGINGDAEALKKVAEGGAYRASIAFPFALIGYAMSRYTADWLNGRSIPLVLNTKPIVLTNKAEIDRFQHDTAVENLAQSYERMSDYFELLGNISYETRGKYLEIAL